MKIGILTLPLVSNNGGILQAFALQKFLTQIGYEAILINRRYKPTRIRLIIWYCKYLFLSRKSTNPFLSNNLNEYPSNFIMKYIQPQSRLISSNNSLRKYIEKNKISAVVVGSDQVWRLEYSGNLKMTFFLDFITNKNVKKISYAASFGNDNWVNNSKITNRISSLLNKFDSISVRESSGIKICKEIFNRKSDQHIDPTLLITKEDYIKLIISENEPQKDGELFYYFLDSNEAKIDLAQKISTYLNHKSYTFKSISVPNAKNEESLRTDSVTSWLRGFMDAKFVLTDSYHGCIFSIIFNKPFMVIGNTIRGLSRFNSILQLFCLEERLILDLNTIDMNIINQPISFEEINDIIRKERTRSINYIKNNLNN